MENDDSDVFSTMTGTVTGMGLSSAYHRPMPTPA